MDKSTEIIKVHLSEDNTLGQCTLLTVDDIVSLLELVLTTTYSSFRNQICKQKFGTAMGSIVYPIVCSIFMEHLEQLAVELIHLTDLGTVVA